MEKPDLMDVLVRAGGFTQIFHTLQIKLQPCHCRNTHIQMKEFRHKPVINMVELQEAAFTQGCYQGNMLLAVAFPASLPCITAAINMMGMLNLKPSDFSHWF